MLILSLFFTLFLFNADAFLVMHNPPGSQNRFREAGGNQVQNTRRLFAAGHDFREGGYAHATAPLQFHVGSEVTVVATTNLACGVDVSCQLIVQYLCGSEAELRDGNTTSRAPNDVDDANELEDDGVTYRYGMHESYDYFQECRRRERNGGLYTADVDVDDNAGATSTRQSPSGGYGSSYGFECDEERDYYPYWHPSPWIDKAVLLSPWTEEAQEACEQLVAAASQNNNDKGHCTDLNGDEESIENAQAYNYPLVCGADGYDWVQDGAHGLAPPVCDALFRRERVEIERLGALDDVSRRDEIGLNDVHRITFNFTVPPCRVGEGGGGGCRCVLRLRLNVTTADVPADADAISNLKNLVETDPTVQFDGLNLSLAMQASRLPSKTYEDRSHSFVVLDRYKFDDDDDQKKRVVNVNVAGRRGNVVQTLPMGLEFEFAPRVARVSTGDALHFQWTSSDNVNGEGAGTDRTERSNLVLTASDRHNMPLTSVPEDVLRVFSMATLRSLAYLDQELTQNCSTLDALIEKHGENNMDQIEEDEKNCAWLNQASARYSRLVTISEEVDDDDVVMNFISTRNNDANYRAQRLRVEVNHDAQGLALNGFRDPAVQAVTSILAIALFIALVALGIVCLCFVRARNGAVLGGGSGYGRAGAAMRSATLESSRPQSHAHGHSASSARNSHRHSRAFATGGGVGLGTGTVAAFNQVGNYQAHQQHQQQSTMVVNPMQMSNNQYAEVPLSNVKGTVAALGSYDDVPDQPVDETGAPVGGAYGDIHGILKQGQSGSSMSSAQKSLSTIDSFVPPPPAAE